MLIYLILGVIVTFFFDWILTGTKHQLNNRWRLVVFIFWPIMAVGFLYNLIQQFINKNHK